MLYLKDTQKWKQFTTNFWIFNFVRGLCYISKILKNESNSQQEFKDELEGLVVLYLKDTQKWKQFTTGLWYGIMSVLLCYISKILKNESNSQQGVIAASFPPCCVISQRYSKMKAIHNCNLSRCTNLLVVLYLKDTQKWKQFTTIKVSPNWEASLCYISKILKNESNSQHILVLYVNFEGCVISQRYSKMKAIHNVPTCLMTSSGVVLYLKDTQKWKQFTTISPITGKNGRLCYISKILKNESNSQQTARPNVFWISCVISQRYSKMKAIHN